ncbi:hypothetical protein MYX65_06645 [Acidobacteria bacterium AH-259-L09]|nr:hypothetical protein [Acidobacteria bacterium AH-259-L09]
MAELFEFPPPKGEEEADLLRLKIKQRIAKQDEMTLSFLLALQENLLRFKDELLGTGGKNKN